ncbi:sulfotransferase family protein [Motilibacter rhizosphaerae]|uniref:Sulfotransferase family protein n=1 Tax=Motilibacter rhizosphaerae TaxID=598652 RepID=A0A4Q7NY84_9ACTN|nr:sulfotransferase [Motilibacter rhizosphaerae]RZS91352.1 sulfotransferase family protein [Motilibacter rhizosphaerae]
MPLPDFFLIGAPKAGTTALHAALRAHPQLSFASVKEPKYFMCGDARPRRETQRGPGDAHSAQEWVWQRDRYEALFAGAPQGALLGESTPFYLYDLDAQRRIAAARPDAKLVAVVRDPVDRAYSNWMHLWSDGLEPEADFLAAVRDEDRRVAAGWAPFWHYRRQGRYGEQLQHLLTLFPREQVLVLRYRQLVDAAGETLDRVSRFLGVAEGQVGAAAPENVRPYVDPDARRTRLLRPVLRAGFALGAYAPPQVWRAASRPLLRAYHAGGAARPTLSVEARREVQAPLLDDIAVLEEVTGESFADWRGEQGRGEFRARQGRISP